MKEYGKMMPSIENSVLGKKAIDSYDLGAIAFRSHHNFPRSSIPHLASAFTRTCRTR